MSADAAAPRGQESAEAPASSHRPAWISAGWNALAAFLVLLAPHLAFLEHHHYSLISAETAALVSALGLASLLIALLVGPSKGHWRALVFAGVLLLCTELLVDVPQLGWRLRWVALILIASCWLLRKELPKVLVAVFLVFDLTTVLQARVSADRLDQPEAGSSGLPLLVHLVLDSQEGLDALPTDTTGTGLRDTLLSSYERHGFRVFGAAYSRYFMTKNSLGNMVNFTSSSRDYAYFEGRRSPRLLENSYFGELIKEGYQLRVLQSSWIDFCGGVTLPSGTCRTYHHAGLEAIAEVDAGAPCRALLLERIFLQRSTLVKWARRKQPRVWSSLARLNEKICRDVFPDWLFRSSELPSLASYSGLEILEQVASEVRSASQGTAVFAHLLLPHSPFVFRADCSRLPASEWLERDWEVDGAADESTEMTLRLDRYAGQVRCLHDRVDQLLGEISARADPVWVVIHGDHGSRVVTRDPIDQDPADYSALDMVHGYSAWYAVRAPHIAPGYDPTPFPLEELLLATVVERRAPRPSTPSIFLERHEGSELYELKLPEWAEMLAGSRMRTYGVAATATTPAGTR